MNELSMHYGLLMTAALMTLLATGCSEEETVEQYALCSPRIDTLESVDVEHGVTSPVSSAGGVLRITGGNFWLYLGTSGDSIAYGDLALFPYTDDWSLQVYVGDTRAEVLNAYEYSVPDAEDLDLPTEDDTPVVSEGVSNCNTCLSCVDDNDLGCGGCETECAGCVQVVEFRTFQILPGSGGVQETNGTLRAPISLFASDGQSNIYYYDFVPACTDGRDNDSDGFTDGNDDACATSPWSELLACEDGLDNDGDGWIDLEDPGCLSADDMSTELAACSDGIDNDGDGWIDLEDDACEGEPEGRSEEIFEPAFACSDGIDNDGDELIDAEDLRCSSGTDDDESQP